MARTKPKPKPESEKSRGIVVSGEPPLAPTSSAEVRDHLEQALDAMLVGPFLPDQGPAAERWGERAGQEILHIPPSRWYLTGFLVPEADERSGAREEGDELDDELERPDTDKQADAEPGGGTKTVRFLPASLGMTVLLPPRGPDSPEHVTLTLRYADYHGLDDEAGRALRGSELPLAPGKTPNKDAEQRKRKRKLWFMRRGQVREGLRVRVVEQTDKPLAQEVPDSRGLEIVHQLREVVGVPGLPDGTRALSVFVVNRRTPPGESQDELARADESKVFQVSLELRHAGGLFAREDRRFAENDRADFDDQVADLQYCKSLEWAVGHSVATTPMVEDGRVVGAKTLWLPRRTVAKVKPAALGSAVTVELETLAKLTEGKALRAALDGLPAEYAKWIAKQRALQVHPALHDTREALMRNADRVKDRLVDAIALLASDAQVRRAFCLTNQAMLDQTLASDRRKPNPVYRHNGGKHEPSWHLFQLAFVLLNLRGVAEPQREREIVELLYFPTGGGKTEAYLGVIAFTLLLRRLRGRTREDGGYGVAVVLRYTLRLLTLDQFERAARLVCALELLRRAHPGELGELRFSVGLWVGVTATANTLRDAMSRLAEWRDDGDESSDPPAPLTECPWCGRGIGFKKNGVEMIRDGREVVGVRLECANRDCEFHYRKPENEDHGLPVVYVDEQIYRELPSFLLATVDKFAMMPFRGETGMLFGRVHSRQGLQFFGPLDSDGPSAGSQRLPKGLRPPELIVQDELHLISGPLGTMVGLYESVIDQLCRFEGVGPKIIAATATVRRADHQISALYGGRRVEIFPPRGTEAWDSFFAEEDREANRRKYLGVAAPGRSLKRVVLNVYTTLLGAAARCWDPSLPADVQQFADPYMTLIGYFNSLRELGGTTRLVEDQVLAAAQSLHERKPVDFDGPHPWLAARKVANHPLELTSRLSNESTKRAKARLAWLAGRPGASDVVLASNMIGTGIDIDRLGLMVIAGQPKSTSDYIQGSSRVGRDDARPGLVVTLYNMHKPRDRSHFEHFELYHDTFYRAVESKSVTPFSLPALERGLTGVLMAMVRLENQAMTPKDAVMKIVQHGDAGRRALDFLVERARGHRLDGDAVATDELANVLFGLGKRTLDDWARIVGDASTNRVYSAFDVDDRRGKGHEGNEVLRTLEKDLRDPAARSRTDEEARFAAPTSMRDVEPVVHLWVRGRH